MHPTLNGLLTIRDGGESDATHHVLNCTLCQQKLANIESIANDLNNLPEQDVPHDTWNKILGDERITAQFVAKSYKRFGWSYNYAVAASLIIAIFITIFTLAPSSNNLISDQPTLMAESKALIYTLAGSHADKDELTSRQLFKIEQLQWQLMALDQRLAAVGASKDSEQVQRLLGQRIQSLKELRAAYSGDDPNLLRPVERNVL